MGAYFIIFLASYMIQNNRKPGFSLHISCYLLTPIQPRVSFRHYRISSQFLLFVQDVAGETAIDEHIMLKGLHLIRF